MLNFVDKDYKKVLSRIMDLYYSKAINGYIPAIVEEGSFFKDNEELYMKAILVNKDEKVDRTWMCTNLTHNQNDSLMNLIVSYNYKFNMIYGLNPFLMNDEYIVLVDQKDSDVIDMVYNDTTVLNKKKVLFKKDKDFYLYANALEGYIDISKGYSTDYNLYVEIEYRLQGDLFEKNINVQEEIPSGEGFVDVNYASHTDIQDKVYWLRATIKVDLNKLKVKEVDEDTDFCVFSLDRFEPRTLNPHNWNDDMEAGFVCFSLDAVEELKKYYYFYDLRILPKTEGVRESLIDVLEDCIVFWEGEFNSKLPKEIKDAIKPFNLKVKPKHLYSKAMYEWQLMAKWDINEYLEPNQLLASIFRNKFSNKSFDRGVDFYPPKNCTEFRKYMEDCLYISEHTIEDLHIKKDKEILLNDILSEKTTLDGESLNEAFMAFSYLLSRCLDNEN